MNTRKKDWKLVIGNFLFKYRSITPIPLIVLVFLLFRPRNLGQMNGVVTGVGILLSLGGEMIRALAVGFSLSGTSGREAYFKADGINTRGIYSVTRNPLYIGNFFIFAGLLIVFSNLYALLFFMPFLIVQYDFIILAEERFLSRNHGKLYEQYRHLTPRILPSLGNFKKPDIPFDCKKVLFKENDSIFNMLIMLILILVYKELVFFGNIIHGSGFIGSALVLIILYVVIKVFKKTSQSNLSHGSGN